MSIPLRLKYFYTIQKYKNDIKQSSKGVCTDISYQIQLKKIAEKMCDTCGNKKKNDISQFFFCTCFVSTYTHTYTHNHTCYSFFAMYSLEYNVRYYLTLASIFFFNVRTFVYITKHLWHEVVHSFPSLFPTPS